MSLFSLYAVWKHISSAVQSRQEQSIFENEELDTGEEVVRNVQRFGDKYNLKSSFGVVTRITFSELHLLLRKCRKHIYAIALVWVAGLLHVPVITQLSYVVLPVLMLEPITFIVDYPVRYAAHTYYYTVGQKNLNTVIRMVLIFGLLSLQIPLYIQQSTRPILGLTLYTTAVLLLVSFALVQMLGNIKCFESIFVFIWYFGILNRVPWVDIFGCWQGSQMADQLLANVLVIMLNVLWIVALKRRKSLKFSEQDSTI